MVLSAADSRPGEVDDAVGTPRVGAAFGPVSDRGADSLADKMGDAAVAARTHFDGGPDGDDVSTATMHPS